MQEKEELKLHQKICPRGGKKIQKKEIRQLGGICLARSHKRHRLRSISAGEEPKLIRGKSEHIGLIEKEGVLGTKDNDYLPTEI